MRTVRSCIGTLILACLVPVAWAAEPEWLWTGSKASQGEVALFRKSFTVAGEIKSAVVAAACDDEVVLYLNGEAILRQRSWKEAAFAGVSEKLKPGANTFAARAKNGESAAGLIVRLDIEYKNGQKQAVVTDPSWKVLGAEVAGFEKPAFDDSTWAKPHSFGKLGVEPWGQVSLVAAEQPRPQATPADRVLLAPGFKVELLYSVPGKEQGSWVSLAVDPRGRLVVSDQDGSLYRIQVPSGGQPVAVEKLDIGIGMAQGLLFAFDSLYVVVNGSAAQGSGLYRVRDTNGDDQFDEVKLLRKIEGGGEHGPHGVVLTPDGKSLMVIGGNHTKIPNPESSRVPRNWQEDQLLPRMWDAGGHAVGIMAPGGWVCRTDPDGKAWELVSSGYRNAYDLAYNPAGELFTYDSDMEWDIGSPWYRPTRVSHVTSGSELGWRSGSGKWPEYYPDSLPATVNIGPGSPTGICFGTGAKFPARYQQALFINDWSYGNIYAVHLTPNGSSYTGEFERFATAAPLPVTDLVIHPRDGAMYFTIGGRRTQSGLYRVTYVGEESTAAISTGNEVGAEARETRRKLEAYHAKTDPKAVDLAWPHLSDSDRFVRYAARVAIEHQPVAIWQDRVLQENNPTALITGVIALARCGDKSLVGRTIEALGRVSWTDLSHEDQLGLLRAYGLVFIRWGEPTAEVRATTLARLDRLFPTKDVILNRELGRLLIYLEAPQVAARCLDLMAQAQTQEDAIHYAFSLRSLKNGWTLEQRRSYFGWFSQTGKFAGGHSFTGFLTNAKNEASALLTDADKKSLADVLAANVGSAAPVVDETPRPVVREWTYSELATGIDQELRGRNFEHGRRMFAIATCYKCHRFASEGGIIGPDLTGVGKRFTNQYLLESLLEPSKTISDQYQASVFVLDDGRTIVGKVANLNNNTLNVITNMLEPGKMVGIETNRIEEQRPSPTSMMPTGLLNVLTRDEILDLLAYLRSGGDPKHEVFR